MKSAPASAKGFLIRLAAEGLAPLVAGCAGALLAGPAGAVAGGVVGKVCEEAVRYFGPAIVESWLGWFQRQPPSLQAAAVEAVATLSPAEARSAAEQAIDETLPNASPQDRAVAVDYLSSIPSAMRRSLVAGTRSGGGLSVPATMMLTNPRQLLGLLPHSLPPYQPGSDLPGTPYRLHELLGAGGFGAVYKATTPTLQHLAFAIKFCLDVSLMDALRRERANLDRLQSAGTMTAGGGERIVRLYGYDFEHQTPYLVYEFVPGSDLAAHLAGNRATGGKGMPPAEALGVIKQVAEALAFAHQRGLVHRDLKPANVLVGDGGMKLTDFGIGSVTSQVGQRSRIGTTTLEQLDAAEQATLFRGAGTALYMSPEQRRGEPADPRHDLFSLGVMWYQLLVGDVTRELHPGWSDELLEEHDTPPAHVEAIRACVGVMKKRPENGGKLLELLAPKAEHVRIPVPAPAPAPVPAPRPAVVLDAVAVAEEPKPRRLEPQAARESVARAVVAAEQARMRDWRWGLMLAGIITGSISAAPFVLFLVLALSIPTTPANGSAIVAFVVMALVFGAISGGFALTAVLMGWSRGTRQAETRQAVAAAAARAQAAFSLPAAPLDADNHETVCQEGWGVVREIEDRHLSRKANAVVALVGSWFFDYTIKVYVDGYLLGAGGTRRGLDLPVRLCRGTHLIEMRLAWQNVVWKRPFVVSRDGNCRVEIGPLTNNSGWWKLEVVATH